MNNLSNEKLQLIVAYNEVILEKADGDQGSAVGLITLYDEETDTVVYDPFYDTSFRCAVEPIEAYGEEALLSMIAEWELLGGNQRKRIEI